MIWSQADWSSVPTALTAFAAIQEWEAGSLTQTWNALGVQWADLVLLWLSQDVTSLYLNSPYSNPITSTWNCNSDCFNSYSAELNWELNSLAPSLLHYTIFSEETLETGLFSYLDYIKLQTAFSLNWIDFYVCSAIPAQIYNTIITSSPTWFIFIQSLDPLIILCEIFLVAVVCISLDKWLVSNSRQVFYDDFITLCKYNNLSVTEIAVTLTLSVGFIFFDIFVSFAEEDVVDSLNYMILLFILLTFAFLIIAVDIQYFFMISNTGGDLTLRVVLFDLINNLLGALRVFFCWIRYVFYDLQVELVDMAFQYTDSVNEISLSAWFEIYANNTYTNANRNTGSLWVTSISLLWALIATFIDITLYILQALTGLFKLIIASFLLWLIVDLFLLRGFALDESKGLAKARTAKKIK